MLDVHPPHHAANTWRDFFIHIATICVGLLIAIGLEQTVEAIHRAEERKTLIDALQAESKANVADLEKITQRGRSGALVLRTWIGELRDARPEAGRITVQLPSETPVRIFAHTPSRSVWAAAKASGKVALLPDTLTQVYDRVDFQGERYEGVLTEGNLAAGHLTYFMVRTGQTIEPGATLHLSFAQRDELQLILSALAFAREEEAGWGAEWAGASRAVLDGVQSRAAMWDYIDRASRAAEIR